jgi:hypothetical protein
METTTKVNIRVENHMVEESILGKMEKYWLVHSLKVTVLTKPTIMINQKLRKLQQNNNNNLLLIK